ncbi:serine hydrolase [Ramlibacter sp. WS9]|uniref:serine hydrolase domain-containing protein n=1 Tax=Ramlibacter sp. WS9 TaxID=1882741 RepID=UPI001142317A|nr:serine hydrolase [Ramlibacter sp. WS9]ROZ62389.1 class C beta-lactamase-related serine hydrolase [Ramlibacter sp. WS9]
MHRTIRHWARLALALLCVASCAIHAQVYPAAAWQKAPTPEAAGWSAAKLKAADDYARANLKTDAWMLVHKGVVVYESGSASKPSDVASVRKSVLDILAGIYADREAFPMDKTLAQLGIDDKEPLTETEKQATVRQLMQARSGVYHPAGHETAAMKAARPARGSRKPGEFFYYNNWDFNALGTIFRQTTGKTVFESLRDDLAGPLQMQDFNFDRDVRFSREDASVHPAYVMRLSVRDMARVGLLMSRGGRWNDRQIVSRAWVDESTQLHSSTGPGSGYGYLWWVGLSERYASRVKFPGKVFLAAGNLGQFILVDPVRDIVVAHKVDFELDPSRDVTSAQFVELLARVLEAAP